MYPRLTRLLDKFFETFGVSTHGKNMQMRFQMYLCILNMAVSIVPIITYFNISDDLHITFWMGEAPQYVALLTPICFFALNLGVTFFSVCGKKINTKSAQIGCFSLFLFLGGTLTIAGAYVLQTSYAVANELMHECGTTVLTQTIDYEWTRLTQFHAECEARMGKPVPIVRCPGYTRTFPNRVYINYIETVENDFNCVGFCQFWSKPLFNEDAEPGKRCATEIGKSVLMKGQTVAIPSIGYGVVIFTAGICLMGYDHL